MVQWTVHQPTYWCVSLHSSRLTLIHNLFSWSCGVYSCLSCRLDHCWLPVKFKLLFRPLYVTPWTGFWVEPQRLPLLEPPLAGLSSSSLLLLPPPSVSWLSSWPATGNYSPLGSGSIWHHNRPLKCNYRVSFTLQFGFFSAKLPHCSTCTEIIIILTMIQVLFMPSLKRKLTDPSIIKSPFQAFFSCLLHCLVKTVHFLLTCLTQWHCFGFYYRISDWIQEGF